ncbi:hypothetical protein ACMFMF_004712 [Clarireedia jacksonii]
MDRIYNESYRILSDRYLRLRDSSELSNAINLRSNDRKSLFAAALDGWIPDASQCQNSPTFQDGATSTEYQNDRSWDISASGGFPAHENIFKAVNLPEPRTSRPRVGHTKSRRGCYNCKKRKVKCQETYPSCQNCVRNQLPCSYPALQPSKSHAKVQLLGPKPYGNLQSTPTTFSLDDMRLFHHFLLHAHPHLPVGSSSAWICQVPLLAHHNPYLMHAMLALSASHLIENSPSAGSIPRLYTSSLRHRIQAISGLSQILKSTGAFLLSHSESIQATIYVLLFQSCYVPDLAGFFEFLHFSRGYEVLRTSIFCQNHTKRLCFDNNGNHWTLMSSRLVDLPQVPREFVDDAEKSLQMLTDMCGTCRVSRQLLSMLFDVVAALKSSSLMTYFKFVEIYLAISCNGFNSSLSRCTEFDNAYFGS